MVLAISCGDDRTGPNPPVASVTVAPSAWIISPGATIQLTATANDASGATLEDRTITWYSSNDALATVSATGLVTGVAEGDVTIRARSEGKSGSAAVTVQLDTVGELCISQRCAHIAGTIRDLEGQPVAGASVGVIPATNAVIEGSRLAETDAAGHYELEVLITFTNDPPAPLDTFMAYVRATLDLAGEAAVDTSAFRPLIFAFPGRRAPVDTIDLVIDRNSALPRPSTPIVFVHDLEIGDDDFGDLYLINADGGGRRPLRVTPTTEADPAWTPDGQAVLFADKGDAGRLKLIDADGSNLRPFGAGLLGREPRWAPDGRHVAFLAEYTDDAGVFDHAAGVWITKADGTEPYRLPTKDDQLCPNGYCSYVLDPAFGWYPDADRIAYITAIPERFGQQEAPYTTRLSDSTIAPFVGPFPRN
ncbi:MAG TPA: Ig-like domain-containing protein, partial [Gemmatimonadales bacterium]